MSNLRNWLTGREVMKKLDISRLDLFELVESGKLSAHSPDTREQVDFIPDDLPSSLNGPMIDLTKDGVVFVFDELTRTAVPRSDLEKCNFAVNDVETLKEKTHQRKGQGVKKSIVNCKAGTRWEDIKITLIADDTVSIITPEIKERFKYSELGLSDKRKGDQPIVLWTLLKLFAENKGFISRSNPKYDPKLPDWAKRLNMHLKGLFGINESIYTGHYKKEKGYRARINFSNQTLTP